MESFITDPNQADILKTGDRCFDSKLYNAAELLYIKAGNNQKLAQVYVMLQKYALAFRCIKLKCNKCYDYLINKLTKTFTKK